MTESFEPNWSSPPGATILNVLEYKNLEIDEFADQCGMTEDEFDLLLKGQKRISSKIAEILELELGGSKAFWLAREKQYQADKKRLAVSDTYQENLAWARSFPLRDMARNNWISPTRTAEDRIDACLQFFNVSSAAEWKKENSGLLNAVAFRTSPTFESNIESVATWLRQGEIEADKIDCAPWNKKRLESSLSDLKALTRNKNPKSFIPKLREICSASGVALVIIPAPQKCHASGATRFLTPEKALIQLSFRYRSDDHFWFTFFHEVGHLLLHSQDALFIESAANEISEEENEANQFSENLLIPENIRHEMWNFGKKDYRSIMRFAKFNGISAGIVVGQLQHAGIIQRNELNRLKIRYQAEDFLSL